MIGAANDQFVFCGSARAAAAEKQQREQGRLALPRDDQHFALECEAAGAGSIERAKPVLKGVDRCKEAAALKVRCSGPAVVRDRAAQLEAHTGPVGMGTRFRETRIMFGREAQEEMEITAFDPPRSYEVGAESHGCRYHTVFTFSPVDSGTEIEMRFQATPLTMTAKMMAAAFKPMMNSIVKVIDADLEDLKAAAEGEAS